MSQRRLAREDSNSERLQRSRVLPPLRKSASLENESRQNRTNLHAPYQAAEGEQSRLLPTPSTSSSHRESYRQTQPPETGEKSTNDTNGNSHIEKTHTFSSGPAAGQKRKRDREPSRDSSESRKPHRRRGLTTLLQNSYPKERLELSEDVLSTKQKGQFQDSVRDTSLPSTASIERPEKELGTSKSQEQRRREPISYWAANQTWPDNFKDYLPMSSSNNPGKRQRISDASQSGKEEKSRSYSQSRRDGEVPEQYTPKYENYIFTKGLDMNVLRGEKLASEESRKLCATLQEIVCESIGPTVFPEGTLREVIDYCQNRNEAMVTRDVTPMIVPPIASLHFRGESYVEHVCDEVNTFWYDQCVLAGPRPRPDLALGLFSSAFTEAEMDKLNRYKSVNNWTQFTDHLYFPFLLCEVKCGTEGLDAADRQNMHSCSVAVRALLRIEQEADKHRSEKKFDTLNGQILVFSLSHDQKNVRLYGHYAVFQKDKWVYHRYAIKTFSILANENDLVTIHSFVRNLIKVYLPVFVQRLKDAIADLPEPSGLSFSTSGITMENDSQAQPNPDASEDAEAGPQPGDDGVFRRPDIPRGVQQEQALAMELRRQNDQLLEQMEKQRQEWEKQRQELMEQMEKQRRELMEMLKQQASTKQ